MSDPYSLSESLPVAPQSVAETAFALDSWASVRVSGAEAEIFLQGQLSADLRALKPDRAAWASYNSPKGRMLAVMLMIREGDAIDLWMPRRLVEPVSKRLRMFVLRSKVSLQAPGPLQWIAVIGERGADWLAAAGLPVPLDPLSIGRSGNCTVLRAAGAQSRFAVIGTPEALAPMPVAPATTDEAWRHGEILAGIPIVYPETQDRWVAQMANVDLIGAISFDKGCYTGQEVVARLHYLGNLKKRMFLVRGNGSPPVPGTAIRDAAGDGQAVGDVVDAVADDAGFVASAVLQVAVAESARLVLDRATDAVLARPLAYRYEIPRTP